MKKQEKNHEQIPLHEYVSLHQLKEDHKELIKEGYHCPVCERYCKIYRKTITSTMAYVLILLYGYDLKNPEKYVHVEDYIKRKGVYAAIHRNYEQVKYWALIEKLEGEKEDGNPNMGYWRITPEGISFVLNVITKPKYVFTYNDEIIRFSEEQINIKKALRNKFVYEDVLARVEI